MSELCEKYDHIPGAEIGERQKVGGGYHFAGSALVSSTAGFGAVLVGAALDSPVRA
jgi:hypothetical protein